MTKGTETRVSLLAHQSENWNTGKLEGCHRALVNGCDFQISMVVIS